MADNSSVPPPPPPAHKPVPPPPPRTEASSAGQPFSPAIPVQTQSAPAAKGTPAANPAPAARPARRELPCPCPECRGWVRRPSSSVFRKWKNVFRIRNPPTTRLENQLGELGKQLKEEHEKVLIQNLRAKEEEALSARVEQQIRGAGGNGQSEMQEKLRREKHEQEILESRSKAENQPQGY